ncbi:hypothetical protein F1B92_04885 [Campylobacter sp. FMV-PI01]|uniref:Uncharacterized protein n=1 Tax=Campylobacter portucalensis TaxID=2608384 RepID=A0A6L5WH32_9BACT|nr:hypothetical protein [Campylobacter portucalensis]MSN96508.1 hypothetical protein [Campylobacter portucalensis]
MLMFSPLVITLLIVEGVIVFFAFVAFVFSIKILRNYDENLSNSYQFHLAKSGYLISTIITFIMCVKIPLFLYFIWTMSAVSFLVPGAMCAAGIVDATEFGFYLFAFKIINIFFISGWLLVNFEDFKTKNSKFLKLKFKFFIPIFFLLVLEFVLEIFHFSGISLLKPVLCCSEIFKSSSLDKMMFWQDKTFIVVVFFIIYILNFISAYFKIDTLMAIFSLGFLLSSIYALIRFFSPYIYELPTHMCPFCMVGVEYYFVGYLIYIFIFLGSLPGFFVFILELLNLKASEILYKISMFSTTILTLIFSYYPLFYYFKNGVWL